MLVVWSTWRFQGTRHLANSAMEVLSLIGLLVVAYFVVYLGWLFRVDCDLQLSWNERFGKPIDSLRGKVVWITGASSGIGESLAVTLARAGAKLVLSARRVNELNQVKESCLDVGKSLRSSDVLVLPLDVTAFDSHEECFKKVMEHFGTLSILVNNAGRSQRAVWEDIELTVDKEMFDLNVFGVISLSRMAVQYFLKKGEGHIVVMSSLAGFIGAPYSATYTATKHALHGYMNSLILEKAGSNLHVTTICPGPTFSNFLRECFTNKVGEKFGQAINANDKRMTVERCGHLCAVAIANCQKEAWMGLFPFMPLSYLVYFPNVQKLVLKVMGEKMFMKLRDSKNVMEVNQ